MSILYLIILIILFMVILTFTAVLKIAFTLDTERENTRLVVLWLYPFLKVIAEGNAKGPVLRVILFNKKVYKRKLNPKKAGIKRTDLIKAVSTSDIRLSLRYGFKDPFITGVTCGAINAAAENADFVSIKQSPDFITSSDYVYMNATANVNVGNTLINFLKSKAGIHG